MKRLLLALLATTFLCSATVPHEPERPTLHHERESPVSSTTDGHRATRRLAGTDSFVIYGGPGTLEGKFETSELLPDWQGWQGVDLTDPPSYWQVSTHNAANLGDHGAGNRAYWCGQTAEQAPHYFHAPGYGSNWDAQLIYESAPVAEPSAGQTLDIDFLFNIDVEPGYDFLYVEVDSAGTWKRLHPPYALNGTNRDPVTNLFPVPGWRFSDFGQTTFEFSGNDYGGPDGDRVRIRLRFRSDGAFDDQTGLWPTVGGAIQIDDVSLSHEGVSLFEDFEGPGPYVFEHLRPPFAGDFSEIFPAVTDLDPYHENPSPVAVFIDRGQEVRNGPGTNGATSTGGSTSPNWSYGIPGGWVVNHEGGLTAGPDAIPLRNEIWSPAIEWDLPGSADDGNDMIGAVLSFDVYNHLLVDDGIFFRWAIGPGRTTSLFAGDNYVYYCAEGPRWERWSFDVTDLLSPDRHPEIRIALGVHDYAEYFSLPGTDATPAPYFDNVRLTKYRSQPLRVEASWNGAMPNAAPAIANDLDLSTPTARQQKFVALNPEADLIAAARGARKEEVRIFWILKKNPVFEDGIRVVPSASADENVTTGPTFWTGERVASASWGTVFGGLLHQACFPGDVVEYYIQATEQGGEITTLPADLTGFGLFDGSYDQRFVTRALPTIMDPGGTQPKILVYVAGAERTNLDIVHNAFTQLGMSEGIDYDTYWRPTMQGITLVNAGTLAGLSGYETIVVFTGAGSDYAYLHYPEIYSPDSVTRNFGLESGTTDFLTSWSDLPGDRNLVFFGSFIGSRLSRGSGSGPAFLANEMGVTLVADDLRASAGVSTSPAVLAEGAGFSTPFTVSGTERIFAGLDHVEPLAPALRAHAWAMADGSAHPGAAASILKVEAVGSDTKVHLTFPFSFEFVGSPMNRAPVGPSARAQLLAEVFDLIGAPPASGTPTSAPAIRAASMSVSPNPFNPRTTISLRLPSDGPVTLRVYDLRGRVVRTLHRGPLEAGPHDVIWDGSDDRGARTSTGVYLVRAELADVVLHRKVLLLK